MSEEQRRAVAPAGLSHAGLERTDDAGRSVRTDGRDQAPCKQLSPRDELTLLSEYDFVSR